MYTMGSRSPRVMGQFRGRKSGPEQSDSAGGSTGMVRMPIEIYQMGLHCRHLTNTIKPSVCGGDAALFQYKFH